MRHDTSDPWFDLASMNTRQCLSEHLFYFLSGLRYVRPFSSGGQRIVSVSSSTQPSQVSCPLRIRMKCAETPFYGHRFTALARLGFRSALFAHALL
jgi:hypothetical protein